MARQQPLLTSAICSGLGDLLTNQQPDGSLSLTPARAQRTQRITLQHWRHSALVDVLFQLDDEADINLARDYFSYNHFYVIWCIFWELDEDE